MFISSMRTSIVMLLAFTVLTGLAYPAVTTVILQGLFHDKANGSLIIDNSGTIHGSALIGQNFTEPKYFWGRLSATSPVPYNAAASSGSNLGAANPSLQDAVKTRIAAARADAETVGKDKIPVDLVTASGSGLDPNITMAAAFYQIPRVAKARGLSQEKIRELIKENTEKRQFGLLGEPRVNVLKLNLALDKE